VETKISQMADTGSLGSYAKLNDMKLVIQDAEKKQYLTKDGKWTTVAVNAEKFVEPHAASTFAKGTTTKDFRVVLYFPSA
jgi:hypothetical protein